VESKNQFILISGIPPSNGGVGRLMKNIAPLALKNNFSVVTRREDTSLKLLLRDKKPIALLKEVFSRVYDLNKFLFGTYFLKNKTILFVHPQTAGFNLLNRLISRNRVYLYVMDNSFFCIRSYNIHPVKNIECTNCVGAPDRLHPECLPFPVAGSAKKMVDSLCKLKKNANKVTFLLQNNNQSKLLKEHFGFDARCIIVGMDTNEHIESTISDIQVTQYDVVFHGSASIAKGSLWFLEVAKWLPHLQFFMPCSKLEIETLLGQNIEAKNITFKACTWEQGLKEILINTKLVCVPSLWSAPIEGALLKSILCNGEVGIIKTKYGFTQEIPDNVLLNLSPNPSHAAEEISRYFRSGKKLKEESQKWLQRFNSNNGADNIFKSIK
jgi:hypothetical protein